MTRARDWLSVSRHARVTTNAVAAGPYFDSLRAHEAAPAAVVVPPVEPRAADAATIEVTFSELAAFLDCAMAHRLRDLVGFQPRLAPEPGYGKAVHHVLRTVADRT
jgi:DNA helicase-2/ATP-dependent DNA helicase PcrA